MIYFWEVLRDFWAHKKIKPFLSVITGDFNAKTPCWWSEDINTSEGLKLLSLTSANGVSQLINEPTHLQTSNFSCIDLIFTDQPNLSVNCRVNGLLHPNWHHQIVHSSFNLNISYLPPYQVAAFNETMLNLFWNYVPNKYIAFDDKDPVWMNENKKQRPKKKIHSTKNIFKMEELKVTLFFLKI